MSATSDRDRFNEEMARTGFRTKAVSRAPMREVFAIAKDWFGERGYRVLPSGRPNQIYIMGGAEGALPRVNGDILAVEEVAAGGGPVEAADDVHHGGFTRSRRSHDGDVLIGPHCQRDTIERPDFFRTHAVDPLYIAQFDQRVNVVCHGVTLVN